MWTSQSFLDNERLKWYEEGAPAAFFSIAKELHHVVYYEALDLIVQTFKEHFDQPAWLLRISRVHK